jgi:glycosyltransferase involved in cell wall biosynthesis
MSDAKMSVLWISQNLPFPPKGGVLQRNYNLLKEASRFADIHLIAVLKKDVVPEFDAAKAATELSKFCRRVDVVELATEASRVVYLLVAVASLFTRAPFTLNWAKSGRLRNAIATAMRGFDFDLVFFDTISLAPYQDIVKRSACILNHHNCESQLFERRIPFERNVLKRAYLRVEAKKLRLAESALMPRFAMNFAVSALDADRLRDIGPTADIEVVSNGVDVDYFRSTGLQQIPGNLLMVGGMNWFPNRDAALFMLREIWPRLVTEVPSASLTIVGSHPPPAVEEIGQRDRRVTVCGFVDDVRPYMDQAQIFVCPMRDGGGTRLKILDALAMGKPIVATEMAVEGIGVEPEREVLLANSPEDFVRQVKRLIDDPELRTRLSTASRKFVEEKFAWPIVGERMRALFERASRRSTPVEALADSSAFGKPD